MYESTTMELSSSVSAIIIRADGTHKDCGIVAPERSFASLQTPPSVWRKLWAELKWKKIIPAALTFAAFMHSIQTGDASPVMMGLVTTAGVNYLAADMLSASANRINAFTFQDAGTGATAEAIANTALVTPAGIARVSGAMTNPVAGQFRNIATLAFTSTLVIAEWGLFSAASVGTLWDRRLVSPTIGVNNLDSIQFTYTCTVTAGGS